MAFPDSQDEFTDRQTENRRAGGETEKERERERAGGGERLNTLRGRRVDVSAIRMLRVGLTIFCFP